MSVFQNDIQKEINSAMLKNINDNVCNLRAEVDRFKRDSDSLTKINNRLSSIESTLFIMQYPNGLIESREVEVRYHGDYQNQIIYNFVKDNVVHNIFIEFNKQKLESTKVLKDKNGIIIGLKYTNEEKYYVIDYKNWSVIEFSDFSKIDGMDWNIV